MSYRATWYPFVEQPEADSCWSLSAGPDGCIYAAACHEGVPGGTVDILRYDSVSDRLVTLFDLAEAVEDPPESGRAPQCKVHYGFAPSPEDGILYIATHLSGPPIDLWCYSPWFFWDDPARCFRGAALAAFDTTRDEVLWWDTLFPKEGCRCMVHDPERRRLYALSYPRDHLWMYDLETRTSRDLGRIGSVNAQALMLDRRGRVWTSCDYGRMVRYDPERDRLEISPHLIPHNDLYQTGWHSVLYDAVMAPEGDCAYCVTWIAHPRLFRFWPEDGEWGRIEDLGPATQERPTTVPMDTFTDHCGGLVFGPDGMLYFVKARWSSMHDRWTLPTESGLAKPEGRRSMEGVLVRLDPVTLVQEELLSLERPEGVSNYMSRGAIDANGDLFFGLVNHPQKPNGIFKVSLPEERKAKAVTPPLRLWG